jgi:phosphatidylserine/phosphatidylglycerophosphate/cardiolipin synthase-like enzyme
MIRAMTAACLLLSLLAFAGGIEVYFSPDGGCTDAIAREIGKAEREILVQAYSFTSKPIAKALVDAHKRGVVCRVILDKSQRTEKYSAADFLAHSGIETWIDSSCRIAHSKVMVIDGATVITGSFNFTEAAERCNAENLLVVQSPELAKRYRDNWQHRRSLSEPYAGRDSNVAAPKADGKPLAAPAK